MATTYLTPREVAGYGTAAGFEPQRVNHWTLIVTGITSGDVLRLCTRSSPLPKGSNSVLELKAGNEASKVAGRFTQENMSLKFMDFVDRDVMGIILAWRKLVYDKDKGLMGLAKNYKKSGTLSMYGPDGNTERKYTLDGIWPSEDPGGELDQEGDGPLFISLTLAIDRFYYSTVDKK